MAKLDPQMNARCAFCLSGSIKQSAHLQGQDPCWHSCDTRAHYIHEPGMVMMIDGRGRRRTIKGVTERGANQVCHLLCRAMLSFVFRPVAPACVSHPQELSMPMARTLSFHACGLPGAAQVTFYNDQEKRETTVADYFAKT
eukprot:scaffold229872_cov23-Tisochrysis_lutea.AAC.1